MQMAALGLYRMYRSQVYFLVLLLIIAGCSRNETKLKKGEDIFIANSIDGKFKATLREVNIDDSVMVSQPYQIIIESFEPNFIGKSVILEADKTNGFVLSWSLDNELIICYGKDTQIWKFQNRFTSISREPNDYRRVEIILIRENTLTDCKG